MVEPELKQLPALELVGHLRKVEPAAKLEEAHLDVLDAGQELRVVSLLLRPLPFELLDGFGKLIGEVEECGALIVGDQAHAEVVATEVDSEGPCEEAWVLLSGVGVILADDREPVAAAHVRCPVMGKSVVGVSVPAIGKELLLVGIGGTVRGVVKGDPIEISLGDFRRIIDGKVRHSRDPLVHDLLEEEPAYPVLVDGPLIRLKVSPVPSRLDLTEKASPVREDGRLRPACFLRRTAFPSKHGPCFQLLGQSLCGGSLRLTASLVGSLGSEARDGEVDEILAWRSAPELAREL